MRSRRLAVAAPLLVLFISACGGGGGSDGGASVTPSPSPTPAPAPAGQGTATISIQGSTFVPLSLQVVPGTVVTVRNLDAMTHSVTSQTAPGLYTRGGVAGVSFDTGDFLGTATFTIPATAPVGTVVPFYCSTHGSTMATPNGEVRVVSAVDASSQTPEEPPPVDPVYGS